LEWNTLIIKKGDFEMSWESPLEKAADACDLSDNMKKGLIGFVSVLEHECKNPVWTQVVEIITFKLELLDDLFYLGYKFIQNEKPAALTHLHAWSRDGINAIIQILRSKDANESNYNIVDYSGNVEESIKYDIFQELDAMTDSSSSPNDVYGCMRYLKSMIIAYQIFHTYRKHLPNVPPIEHDVLICEGFPEAVNLIGIIRKGEWVSAKPQKRGC
jgi:hypothetical protein